jgi:DNA-binding transcriptional ArsR family regulator
MENLWIFNEGRIAILCKLLGCRSARGCDLKESLKMKPPILSHHLGMLRNKGIIEERKEGRDKYYYIRPEKRVLVKNIIKIVE